MVGWPASQTQNSLPSGSAITIQFAPCSWHGPLPRAVAPSAISRAASLAMSRVSMSRCIWFLTLLGSLTRCSNSLGARAVCWYQRDVGAGAPAIHVAQRRGPELAETFRVGTIEDESETGGRGFTHRYRFHVRMSSVLSLSPTVGAKVAEAFDVAGELDAAPRDGVIVELAAMTSHGAPLASTVNRDANIDLVWVASRKARTELFVECTGDLGGKCPREDHEIHIVCDADRGSRRGLVVEMARDPRCHRTPRVHRRPSRSGR